MSVYKTIGPLVLFSWTHRRQMAASSTFIIYTCYGMQVRQQDVRNMISDDVEVSARKSRARLQIIQVLCLAEPRMRLALSKNMSEIFSSRP